MLRIINLIIGELISNEWKLFEKKIQLERLLDFITHILEVKQKPFLVNILISNLPFIINKAHGKIYYIFISDCLHIPHILQFVKTNLNAISMIVNNFYNSLSFDLTRIGIDLIRLISDSLNKTSWTKIVEFSSQNNQIYNAGGILSKLSDMIKEKKIKLKSSTILKIKESAEKSNSDKLLKFYASLKA